MHTHVVTSEIKMQTNSITQHSPLAALLLLLPPLPSLPSSHQFIFLIVLPFPKLSYKWNNTVCGLLSLTSFSKHNA